MHYSLLFHIISILCNFADHRIATAIPRWKTDWTKCCLCQEDRDEELKSPPTRYAMEQDGYSMIGKNILMFQSINEMPIKFDPARLDDSGGAKRMK